MEVEIDGILAEIGDSEPAITRKSIDINNPSARFLDITNKFQLPDTVANRRIFDSPRGIGTNNRSFDKIYSALIRDVYQFFKGKGYLSASTRDKSSFQIIDDSKELFKALEVKLRDVSWDDCDTVLTQAAINLLDAVDLSTCWYWGKACYHKDALVINTDQTTGDARCKYSRPVFYVQALLKRAIELQGYTFTSPVPDIAFSSCHKDFFFTSYQKTITATYTPSGTLAMTGLNTNDFAYAVTTASTTINIGVHNTAFRIRGQVTSTAVIALVVRATDNLDPTKISESKFVLPASGLVDFTSSEFSSADGNTIDVRFEGTGTVVFTSVLLYTILSDKNEDLSTNPWLNYKIKAYDNLPELTYKELFTLICTVSNKFQIVSTLPNTFSFGSFSNLNKLNAVDWSDKFVIGSEEIRSDFKNLAQLNRLKYENDLTVNPELGWDSFETDNESLEAEGDYIVLKFGASNDIRIGSNDVAQMNVYNNTTRIPDQEIAMRLFAIVSDKLQFTPVSWTNLKAYYAQLFLSLYRIRLITCQVNLSKLDVLKWNEKQLVYIEYFKSTFLVLEIANFIPGKLTKVKLLNYGR
jgi:hypothetical protein